MIIWLGAALRQFPTKYRYYFLITAINDPLNMILGSFLSDLHINGRLIMVINSVLIYYSILFFDKKKQSLFALLIMPLTAIIVYLFTNDPAFTFFVIRIFIFFILFRIASVYLYEQRLFSVFKYLLVFYELTVLTNMFLVIAQDYASYNLFMTTIIFQILIGVFFIIFREDKSNLEFKIRDAAD